MWFSHFPLNFNPALQQIRPLQRFIPYESNLPLLRLRSGHLPRRSTHFCWWFFYVLALETPLVTFNKSFWETHAALRLKTDPLESYSFSKGIRKRKHVSNSNQKTERLRRVVRDVVHCVTSVFFSTLPSAVLWKSEESPVLRAQTPFHDTRVASEELPKWL